LDFSGRPIATLGQKGMVAFELHVKASKQDEHSMWGALVPNLLWRIVWALSTLKDPDEHVNIEGIRENIVSPTEAEMDLLNRIPFEFERLGPRFGIDSFPGGVSEQEALARHLFAPICNITAIWGGYTGPGAKSALPSEAFARIEIRLVPALTPHLVANLLRAHLDRRGFHDIELATIEANPPFRSPLDQPLDLISAKGGKGGIRGADSCVSQHSRLRPDVPCVWSTWDSRHIHWRNEPC